nr:PREDICTED: spartin isoform X3 [Bemisia tabaci]
MDEPRMDWKTTYETLKSFHDAAYKKIDEGIKFEAANKKAEAADSYEEGLDFLKKAFELRVECPSNPDLSWEKACVMLQKMKKSRKDIESRLSAVKSAIAAVDLAPPPSYEEAIRLPSTPSTSDPSAGPSQPPSWSPPAVSSSSCPPPATSSLDGPSSSGPPMNGGFSAWKIPQTPSPQEKPPANPEKHAEANRSNEASAVNGNEDDSLTYAQLNDALNALKMESEGQSAKIVYTVNNVEVYYITPEGNVCATTGTDRLSILNILRIDNDSPQFLLQIGDWIYPLMPGVSPYILTNYGAFIFPNTISEIEGEAIGVIVPAEAREQLISLLDDILHPPDVRTRALSSDVVSNYIEKGTSYVSSGLIKGAEKASYFLNVKTPKLLERLAPSPDPAGQPVNPNVAAGLKTARNVTGTAANVSGFILNSLGSATKELGTYLAPHIHKGGSKLLSRATGLDNNAASEKMSSFMTVASSAVEGIATVSTGLETAASILGQSLTSNTVKVVEHKYGQPTGQATEDALFTVGNTITVSSNMRGLSAKGLAKKGLKNAGKGALKGFSNQVAFDSHHLPPSNLPPSLPSSSQQPSSLQSSSQQSLYPSLTGDQFSTSHNNGKSL